MSLFLIRARLREDASIRALAPLLIPDDGPARASAAHRLVWSLMPADPDAPRDFLWREEGRGRFMLLAHRPPGPSALFDVEHKPFAPQLAAGDRLAFVLRANPTTGLPGGKGARAKRHDVMTHALHTVPTDGDPKRAAERRQAVTEAGTAWLTRQGGQHGFRVAALEIGRHERHTIARDHGTPITLATVDYAGVIEVTDPAALLAALCAGFGRARAFGCGLMLIRRARGGA